MKDFLQLHSIYSVQFHQVRMQDFVTRQGIALCGACHGGEAVLGVPLPSNSGTDLQKGDLLESHVLAVMSTAG